MEDNRRKATADDEAILMDERRYIRIMEVERGGQRCFTRKECEMTT